MRRKLLYTLAVLSLSVSLSGCDAITSRLENTGTEEPEVAVAVDNIADSIKGVLDRSEKEESLFEFEPAEVKGKDVLAGQAVGKRSIIMRLGENFYYEVIIPDALDIVTDNEKYIYAKDGSMSVTVVSNIDKYAFSESVLIDNAEPLKSNLIATKLGKKGPKEAAIHLVNDRAIIVRTYDNDTAYNMILQGLMENEYKEITFNDMQLKEGKTKLTKLPAYQGFHMTVNPGFSDSKQKMYKFDDGFLIVSEEYRKYEDAISNLATRAGIVTSKYSIDQLYDDGQNYYAEVGDYTVAIYKVNYNTVYTCYGVGDEARYNALAFLRAQE